MTSRDDRQIPLPDPVERDAEDEDWAAPTRRLLRNFVALLAVGGLVGLVWYAYHAAFGTSSGNGVVPLIKADTTPIKEKVDPAGSGGIDVPFRNRNVYDLIEPGRGDNQEKAARARGEHRKPAAEAPEKKAEKASAKKEEADKTAEVKKASEKAAEKPAETKEAAEAKKPAEERKPTEETQTASLPGGFRIQLAAVSSAADADRQWQKIRDKNKDLLGNLHLIVEKVRIPSRKQTLYRIQAGPFKSAKEAHEVCAKLVARKVSCFFVKA